MVIFADKDMSVSLKAVHKKIEEINDNHKEEIKEIRDDYANFANETKKMFSQTGRAHLRNVTRFSIGKPTGHYLNGIELYTGDEIEIHNGRLGIAIVTLEGNLIIKTNAEAYELSGTIKSRARISRHVHTYKDGDEVAKGRKGGEGFIIELNGGK